MCHLYNVQNTERGVFERGGVSRISCGGSRCFRGLPNRGISILQGGPGSVRLRFGDGTVQAVPVFGSGGSSAKRVFLCFSTN